MNNLQNSYTANTGLRFFTVYGPCLSRLSRGRTSVHWGEMRSKFHREVYPVKYETPFHGVNPMKSAKHFTGGRPDMALFLFTKAILEDQPIKVLNNGNMPVRTGYPGEVRDFTYVDDIVEGVMRVIDNPPQQYLTEEDIYKTSTDKLEARSSKLEALRSKPSALSSTPYAVYNIGNSSPVPLMEYI